MPIFRILAHLTKTLQALWGHHMDWIKQPCGTGKEARTQHPHAFIGFNPDAPLAMAHRHFLAVRDYGLSKVC